jgi:hypothetical protein
VVFEHSLHCCIIFFIEPVAILVAAMQYKIKYQQLKVFSMSLNLSTDNYLISLEV